MRKNRNFTNFDYKMRIFAVKSINAKNFFKFILIIIIFSIDKKRHFYYNGENAVF